MQPFVELIKAIAWPVAVVWLGYLFRSEIRKLLGRVSKFKYKDMEADFSKALSEVESEAAKAQLNKGSELSKVETLSKLDQLRRIAEVSPRAAIMEAWVLIERAQYERASMSGVPFSQSAVSTIVHNLVNDNKLPPNSIPMINNLRHLRNQAAHFPDFVVTTNEAERYLEIAVNIADLINSKSVNA